VPGSKTLGRDGRGCIRRRAHEAASRGGEAASRGRGGRRHAEGKRRHAEGKQRHAEGKRRTQPRAKASSRAAAAAPKARALSAAAPAPCAIMLQLRYLRRGAARRGGVSRAWTSRCCWDLASAPNGRTGGGCEQAVSSELCCMI
jgi:pyruvate/2-oxoglutarate dehydrogenase complex dihydrolipoamide acyltransferase (E2) component